MYRARRCQIQVDRNGKIILNEGNFVTELFSQTQEEYKDFNDTLVMAGLR